MPIRKLTQEELKAWLGEGVVMPGPKSALSATRESMKKVPVQNETNDPEWQAPAAHQNAVEGLATDDINRPETEDDGVRAGKLRILKVKHQARSLQKQSRSSVASQPASLEAYDESRLLRLCVEDLENQVQEWLGFDIPKEGTEDYETWQMKTSLIEQVESISDIHELCEGGDFNLPSVLADEPDE